MFKIVWQNLVENCVEKLGCKLVGKIVLKTCVEKIRWTTLCLTPPEESSTVQYIILKDGISTEI